MRLLPPSTHLIVSPDSNILLGPPGQVNAIAGKKDGMKQGALNGILKELGYNEDQVRLPWSLAPDLIPDISLGVQILDSIYSLYQVLCTSNPLLRTRYPVPAL